MAKITICRCFAIRTHSWNSRTAWHLAKAGLRTPHRSQDPHRTGDRAATAQLTCGQGEHGRSVHDDEEQAEIRDQLHVPLPSFLSGFLVLWWWCRLSLSLFFFKVDLGEKLRAGERRKNSPGSGGSPQRGGTGKVGAAFPKSQQAHGQGREWRPLCTSFPFLMLPAA